MDLATLSSKVQLFKELVNSKQDAKALELLADLKRSLVTLHSLPPINMRTSPTWEQEILLAKEVYEFAVILSVTLGDKDLFQKSVSNVQMYYSLGMGRGADEDMRINIVALNLLFLLVQNRLADFHCELELLSDADRKHPYVVFCTQLDEHFTIGSYDSILRAASQPPNPSFNFFLNSLLETVRINIADCASSSYASLTIHAATDLLMFKSTAETLSFVEAYYKDEWVVDLKDSSINVKGQQLQRSEGIPALKVITQSLSYATEMERIV